MAPDAHVEHPRLASIYDALDPYFAIAAHLGARSVLDLGCGTGVLAVLLARRRPGHHRSRRLGSDPARAHRVLTPGGHLVLETRVPAARAWEGWTEEATRRTSEVDGVGRVETWVQVTGVDGPLVASTSTFAFASDGEVLDARDRPGLELVFVAGRAGPS